MIAVVKNIFRNSKGGDRWIYVSTFILAIFGIVMIGSASIAGASTKGVAWAIRNMVVQAGYVVVGAFLMRFISKSFTLKAVNLKTTRILYVIGLAGMLACFFFFTNTKGSNAWIYLPFGFSIQPAEFMKIIMILVLSYMLTETDLAYVVKGKFRNEEAKYAFYKDKFIKCALLPMMMVMVVAAVGMFLQNDLGTTLIISAICFICFMSTPRNYYKKYKRYVMILIGIGAVAVVILATTVLKTHQLERIYTWLNPLSDQYNSGFQLINSLIAFSNGGLFGLGLGNSTQKFGYIPEAHNDFIGAIVYEELGIFGLALVLIPTCIIIFKFLKYAGKVENNKAKIILIGIASYFFLHILVNLGGISGLIPMTGVPLLLISSGGSSTVSAFIALGIGQSIIAKHNQQKNDT